MKSRFLALALVLTMAASLVGCGNKAAEVTEEQTAVEETAAPETEQVEEPVEETESEATEVAGIDLEDGVYQVDFNTDSSMFHVNEAMNGHGTLTVKDGQATVHISLVSDKIQNLYVGLAADAESDEANWLQSTDDEVTYDDGTSEMVHGFDVPVASLDTEFDLALIGEKGVWYDHKVSVTNPVVEE
ncbi:hypothetical protein [Pseudobutyrivibrio xylanivorans]|uniref:Major membrane immunogen, membrane-anchored lipoprotein n=1 Tax=Pseudobutyrivibrio xylanivorans DSM 14809 TaxID=1123012 RepID=A0A1M6CFW7_PSEXY|nr:hypothetical protein [Pseudobutyrivibrio xylanivorans]SHI59930.1 hypothetical protein SAMN02745725_00699 [Pseudobutyrivibrio xylanivorans DSM 14809]